MKAVKPHQLMHRSTVLGAAALMVLGLGLRAAASDQGYNPQPYGQGNQGDQFNQGNEQAQARDLPLERQVAAALRQAGYGAQGEIMILAAGNQVTLLGTVPSQNLKSGAEDIVKGVARGKSVDNRLHVAAPGAPARQLNDTQLESKITSNLSDDLRRDVRVSVQNGTATLQGHVNDWNEMADAIDAAFSAGAGRVNSQFVVGAGMATAQADGAAPSYGYAPGQQGFAGQQGYAGRPGAMAGAGMASMADLRLAQQVAGQLRQQLPPGQNVQLIQPQSIYVSVNQGRVTLQGYVQNPGERQQAEQIVRSIRGVRNVRNDLTLLSTPRAGAPGAPAEQGGYPPSPGYGQAPQGYGGQSQYGQGGQMGVSQGGMAASDIDLAGQVVQQLRQRLTGIQNVQVMRPGTIYVMAANGNVILNGSAMNPGVRQQAAQIARATPGARNVTDRLRVMRFAPGTYPSYGYVPGQGAPTQYIAEGGRPTSSQADIALAQEVGLRLREQLPSFYNVQIATPGTIYVKVDNGRVTLDGFVANVEVKQTAEQIAKSVRGVQSVGNSLSIVGINQTLDYTPLNEDHSAWESQLYDDQPSDDRSAADQPDNGMN
jgi:osmotically-inducible protein OsmY